MRVVVAPDKFKGSLSAPDAAAAMAHAIRRVDSAAEIVPIPMADGGEGTVEALVAATGGSYRTAEVTDPIGRPIRARFGLLGDGETAVIEMAAASGLVLLDPSERDPLRTSTRGTGELLLAAIASGAKSIILGIGGSATNDGGAGLAQALGYRLLDAEGREIGPGGGSLERLDRIEMGDDSPVVARLRDRSVDLAVACDVDNPLCGSRGASAIYGPQKGATPEMVAQLDRNLNRLAAVVERDLGISMRDLPGAGAAGGLGGGLVAFAAGQLRRGVELVLDAVDLPRHLVGADLCLTGEGALDASSAHGKTAVGVAQLARSMNVPVLAIVGSIGEGSRTVLDQGIDAYFSLCPGPITLDEAMSRTAALLENASEQAVRAFLAGRRT